MGLYIEGMKMPKDGHLIVRIYASGEVCEPTECVGVWGKVATAVPVPPHGDLIERKAICLTDFEIAMCGGNYKEGMKMLLKKTESAQTIIPADKEGET